MTLNRNIQIKMIIIQLISHFRHQVTILLKYYYQLTINLTIIINKYYYNMKKLT